MKAFAAFALSVAAFFILGPLQALAGPYDDLSPWQALDELQANIEKLHKTENALLKNGDAAEAFAAELEGLNAEKAELDALDFDYSARVASHNADVDSYNQDCTAQGLDQAAFNSCLSRKSALDYNKMQLDAEANRLAARFSDYNNRVEDFNQREDLRAEAARELLKKYDDYSANVRALQRHLNLLGNVQNVENFAERNQACADLPTLDDMQQCMQSIWDGTGNSP